MGWTTLMTPSPSAAFQYWTDSLGLSPRLAKRVYGAFTQSDPQARAFVFALERLCDAATIKPLWRARPTTPASSNTALSSSATAFASRGGTALPICLATSILDPTKVKESGNVCRRAASR